MPINRGNLIENKLKAHCFLLLHNCGYFETSLFLLSTASMCDEMSHIHASKCSKYNMSCKSRQYKWLSQSSSFHIMGLKQLLVINGMGLYQLKTANWNLTLNYEKQTSLYRISITCSRSCKQTNVLNQNITILHTEPLVHIALKPFNNY